MSSEHHQGFIKTYLFSTDHKMVGKQYLLTGLVMAIVGGLFTYVFRSQLAFPDQNIPGFGQLGAGMYNSLVTMHGTIMIFWVAMPILLGGFGNLLIPLMIGTDDMAFPKLNMFSYWVFWLSTVVLLASLVVPGGSAAGGWTFYPPLAAHSKFSGVEWGGHLWLIAVALEFASMLMGGVNYLATIANKRAKGLTFFKLPIMIWMLGIANILFMFSVGPLIAGAFMMLLDRTAGTHFFYPSFVEVGGVVQNHGGDPLLFQHLFWFFGHPEVYVILLPGLGIISEIIPIFARKVLFGYKTIIWATIIAGLLSFIVWAHHQFISGIDPGTADFFSLTTILISVPFAVFLFALIATLWKSTITFNPAMLFSIALIVEFLWGGVTGVLLGSAAADIYMHDTYFVVAHFHYTLFPAVIIGMFAGIYHWFPKLYGRLMNNLWGYVHFAGTIIFFNMVFLPQFAMGIQGHHRRISNPSNFDFLEPLQGLQEMSTYGVYGLLLSQIPFIINFFHSMYKGKKAEANPWNATTLEWVAPSPPGHGNFDVYPEVYNGPYEYNVPGMEQDYLPQNVPAEKN